MGNGLMQEENTVEGETYITPGMPELLRTAAGTTQITLTYWNKNGTALQTTMHNTNRTLHPGLTEFYRPEAVGLKTGSTSTAGKCLLSAFRRNGRVLLVCVMGCATNAARYEDTLALYQAFR